MEAEVERLEKLVYVPGLWKCAKCAFSLISQTLYVNLGVVGANTSPQQCANGCGPMWRVTERDAGNEACDSLEALTIKQREECAHSPGVAMQDDYVGSMAERSALRGAILRLLDEPYGCRFCDSGKLRNLDKSHDEECGFALARAALVFLPKVQPLNPVTPRCKHGIPLAPRDAQSRSSDCVECGELTMNGPRR